MRSHSNNTEEWYLILYQDSGKCNDQPVKFMEQLQFKAFCCKYYVQYIFSSNIQGTSEICICIHIS